MNNTKLLATVFLCILCVPAMAATGGSFDLTINDVSGLDEPWPLVGGLPFQEGELHDASQIRLVDAAGHEVPAQINVAATWRDGSIRWALAGFTASPQNKYRIEYGPGIARCIPEAPLRLEQGADGGLTIDTGAALYEFLPDRLLPDSARMGDTVFISNAGDGAYLVDNQGRLARVAGANAEIETEILKQGSMRAVIRREGWYVTEDGARVARARMWFYFAAGSPHLRMTHSLVFTEDTNDLWLRDYGLAFNTPESPREVTFALGESDEVFSPRGTSVKLDPIVLPFEDAALYMYQDTYPHFMETEYRAVVGRAPRPPDAGPAQFKQDGPDIFWTNNWIEANDVAGDWGHARYARHGLTLATPYLAQRFPKEIAFDPGSARVALWSSRGGRELDFRSTTLIMEYWQDWSEFYGDGVEELARWSSNAQGMARTHEIWLLPQAAGDGPETIARRAAAVSDPPLVMADPVRLSATDAFGWPLHPRDETHFPEAEAAVSAWWKAYTGAYQNHRPAGGGFIDWGKTRTMRGGRNSFFRLFSGTMDYYLSLQIWGAYARGGERSYFNYGSWINQFAADIGYAHWTAGAKFKGGHAEHGGYARSHTPFYWGTGSTLGATATTASFLNEYFLTGNERLRDVAEMIGESYLERWNPEDAPGLGRRSDGIFNTMAGLSTLYTFTWNEAYAKMAGQLADVLIDLESPNGLSDEIRFGSLYKVDRNLLWLYFYHRATGDERAKQALLKGLDYKYRFSRFRLGGQQDRAGILFAAAYRMTGDPVYLRALNYYMQSGFNRWRLGGVASGSILENPYYTINVPAGLSVLATVDDPIDPFPTADYNRLPDPSRILFRKAQSTAPATFLATVWMEDRDAAPTGVRVTPHIGSDKVADPLADVAVDFEQAFLTSYSGRRAPHVYAVQITVPGDAPAGLYFLDVPRAARIRVLESNVPEIGVYAPQGAAFRGDAMPNYFRVNAGIAELHIHLNRPAEIRRPDGSVALAAENDNVGELRLPVADQDGIWSVAARQNTVVGLLNVEPIMARSSDWLPTDAGLEPAPRFEPPSEAVDFVPWEKELALHLPGQATLAFPRGTPTDNGYKHFPRDEGTIEFWFRPNWTSAQLVYSVGGNFRDYRFLRAGSHALLYRRGRLRSGSRELASVQLWLRNKLEDPGGPGRLAGEFTTGNPTLGGHTSQYWFEAGEWYHIAATWRLGAGTEHDEHMTALFVNGEPMDQETRHRLIGAPRELPDDTFPLAETNARIEIGPLDGTIARLRISDTVRYDAAFAPPAQFTEPDPHTVVRFPLNGDFQGSTGTGRALALQLQDN